MLGIYGEIEAKSTIRKHPQSQIQLSVMPGKHRYFQFIHELNLFCDFLDSLCSSCMASAFQPTPLDTSHLLRENSYTKGYWYSFSLRSCLGSERERERGGRERGGRRERERGNRSMSLIVEFEGLNKLYQCFKVYNQTHSITRCKLIQCSNTIEL